jgi:hypothetical protein
MSQDASEIDVEKRTVLKQGRSFKKDAWIFARCVFCWCASLCRNATGTQQPTSKLESIRGFHCADFRETQINQ